MSLHIRKQLPRSSHDLYKKTVSRERTHEIKLDSEEDWSLRDRKRMLFAVFVPDTEPPITTAEAKSLEYEMPLTDRMTRIEGGLGDISIRFRGEVNVQQDIALSTEYHCRDGTNYVINIPCGRHFLYEGDLDEGIASVSEGLQEIVNVRNSTEGKSQDIS